MIRDEIKNLIKKAIKQAQKEKTLPDFEIPEILVEHPEEEVHGDYSTNVALKITKQAEKKPMEIAKKIKNQIGQTIPSLPKIKNKNYFKKIEVAKPGFINFALSRRWLQGQVGSVLQEGDKFGRLNVGKGTPVKSRQGRDHGPSKVQVEFISANPTGPLHLGHGRGAFSGDTLANVLKMAGYNTEREYYINDAKKSGQIRALGKTVLGKSKVYLTEYLRNLVSTGRLLKLSFNKLSEEEAGHLIAQEIHRDIREFIERKLKIKFDSWVSEESLYQKSEVDKIEKVLRQKNLVYEKEGALWLKTTKFGDDKDRVLIKRGGQPTYLLPDIAYHKDKFKRGFNKIIDIWGADHLGHMKPLKIGLKILGCDPQKLEILISQMTRLKKEGKIYKMSKRKGKIVDLGWLIDEVGLDAVRFLYLMKSLDTQMEFDLDLAKERSEKNPVFYVQYAYARICSILGKVRIHTDEGRMDTDTRIRESVKISQKSVLISSNRLTHSSELDLIRQLIKLPEIVEDTSKDYQVQRLPYYALEVASCFHYFYKCCRVISEDKDLTKARLALVLASQIVLKNVLGLMGIHAPKRM